MINFIFGRSGYGKSRRVIDMIRSTIESSCDGIVLIIPEQQTVVWETRIARELPESAYLRLEITNFTRLANSVFREYGGLSDKLVDDGARSLIVWRAMSAVWGQMKTFNNCVGGREDRNIPQLMHALDELKGSGITPSQAEAALEQLENGEDEALAARLGDAVLVYSAYNELLHESYIDRGDLLDKLFEVLKSNPYFRGKSVFIDSFFSLTAGEEKILELIMRQAENVTVTFACPPLSAKSAESEIQFGEVQSFAKNALRLAASCGFAVNKTELTTNHRHAPSSPISALERSIFSYSPDDTLPESHGGESGCADVVRVITCRDRFEEAEACAAIIDKLVYEGYKYSEIAVIARDISKSEGIIDGVLRRHGISYFISEGDGLSGSHAVRLITAALAVQANGWMRRDIIKMIKTGLTPLDEYESDVFELYTETWNIRGRRMYTSPEGWSMNPDGYRTELTERGQLMLEYANHAREKLIPPLERLLSVFVKDGHSAPAGVREICEGIVYFAEEIELEESLKRISLEYSSRGMKSEAEKVLAEWSAVCKILDKLVDILDDGGDDGSAALDAGRFAGLFTRVAASMELSTIPTAVDEVVLGSATGARFDEVRCVIMLGCMDGEFPGNPADDALFFGDADRVKLEAAGLNIKTPDPICRTAREYFMFYRTAAAATERLYVLSPSEELSEGARRICASAGTEAVSFGSLPLREILYSRKTAEYLLSGGSRSDPAELSLLSELCRTADGEDIGLYDIPLTAAHDSFDADIYADDEYINTAQKNPKRKRRLTLSQSKIDKYLSCPFMYWCKFRMKLEPEPKAKLGTPDVGSFVHEILEKFFKDIPYESWSTLSREEIEEHTDRLIASHIRKLSRHSGMWELIGSDISGDEPAADDDISREIKKIIPEGIKLDARLEYLFIRLRRSVLVFIEAIIREIEQSGFKPAAFELPIGISVPGEVSAEPIKFTTGDGTEVVLRGIADRVDLYTSAEGRTYIRIVDYKTGEKTFSLSDVRRGFGVQLLVYLFSVWKSGIPGIAEPEKLFPGGAAYFSARPGTGILDTAVSADEAREELIKRIGRSGIFLADEEILDAMDRGLSGNYIPVKKDKNGALKATSAALATMEEFGSLYRELSDTVCEIAGEIISGNAEAKPSDEVSPCRYCVNRPVCRVK